LSPQHCAASTADLFSFSNWRRQRFTEINACAYATMLLASAAAVGQIPNSNIDDISINNVSNTCDIDLVGDQQKKTPISSQPSAAANACACSAVSAQLQNQPQRSISIQLSAQQFGS
jgi:hypothetical protein